MNYGISRKNVEEYFGELLPHAANGNSKKKKDIEEYFGSEIDLNKPALNKADLKLRGLINPPPPKDEGIKYQKNANRQHYIQRIYFFFS